eukprot:5298490-Pleurochrysis_carterae.AAC.3
MARPSGRPRKWGVPWHTCKFHPFTMMARAAGRGHESRAQKEHGTAERAERRASGMVWDVCIVAQKFVIRLQLYNVDDRDSLHNRVTQLSCLAKLKIGTTRQQAKRSEL